MQVFVYSGHQKKARPSLIPRQRKQGCMSYAGAQTAGAAPPKGAPSNSNIYHSLFIFLVCGNFAVGCRCPWLVTCCVGTCMLFLAAIVRFCVLSVLLPPNEVANNSTGEPALIHQSGRHAKSETCLRRNRDVVLPDGPLRPPSPSLSFFISSLLILSASLTVLDI